MTLILSILLGLIFVLLIGVMACGIVVFTRDYCDETLPDSPTEQTKPKTSRPRDAHGRFVKTKQKAKTIV